MPTIFSHTVFASALAGAIRPADLSTRVWILTVLCSVLPDLDVIAFGFGISYNSLFGHRGITHSIFFAILIGIIVSLAFFSRSQVARWKLALYFGGVTVSHPLLDMFTSGGLGVALFAPFSNERYFAPWRPVRVSPIGLDFFGARGVVVIVSEFLWIWLPSALIISVSWLVRRKW